MKKEHLHLLIHEEIYQVPEKETTHYQQEVKETLLVSEPEPMVEQEEEKQREEPTKTPMQEGEASKKWPLAIFYQTSNPAEIDLLHKIIVACELSSENYQVSSNGFDPSIHFNKAVVFSPTATAYYIPIPYKDSQFLCSKPLADLIKDQQEKTKLWNALRKFI